MHPPTILSLNSLRASQAKIALRAYLKRLPYEASEAENWEGMKTTDGNFLESFRDIYALEYVKNER
jgi:hypothetical protein